MRGYVIGFIFSGFLSLFLTWLLAKWAKERGWFMPIPRARDSHQTPTPRIGGIAIVVAFLLVIGAMALFSPHYLVFSPQKLGDVSLNLIGLIVAVILLSIVNIADDFRSTPIWLRLTAEIIAALLIFWFGIRLPWLTNPFGGKILLGAIQWLFILVWLTGLSNVMNWLDGINGLAGGVAAIALAILFFLSHSVSVGQYGNAMLSIVALGAVIGFLPYNFGRAKAFLGDTGSVFLGFLIGVIAIISGGKVATAFLVLAIPLLDAMYVFGSRVVHHQSPWQADRRHLHHRLLSVGFKQWQIVGLYYSITLGFGLIALNVTTLGKARAAVAALLLMVILILVYSLSGKHQKENNTTNGG